MMGVSWQKVGSMGAQCFVLTLSCHQADTVRNVFFKKMLLHIPAMFPGQCQRCQRSTFGWIEPFVILPHNLIALQKTSRCKSCCRRNSSQSDQTGNSFLLQLQNTEFYPQTLVHNYVENLGPPIFVFAPLL